MARGVSLFSLVKSVLFIIAALALVASFVSGAILLQGGATKAYASGSGVSTSLAASSASSSPPNFGSNAYIFNPSMPQSEIQATVDAVANQQVSNQFGTQRYALLFEPRT